MLLSPNGTRQSYTADFTLPAVWNRMLNYILP